jgi:hypothetical protein
MSLQKNKADNSPLIIFLIISAILIVSAYYHAYFFNPEIINGNIYHKPIIWICGSFLITITLGILWYIFTLCKAERFGEIILPIFFSVWYFIFFKSNITIDDGGIVLKYLDNAKKGYFYTYNIGDGPIWGISGFLHGLLCNLLALYTPLTAFGALMTANFIELCFFGWALFRFLSNYSTNKLYLYIYWIGGIFFSNKLILCAKQGLETCFHVGLILYTCHLFFNRNTKIHFLLLAWVLCLISKLDSLPIVGIMVVWFLFENRKKLISFDKKIYFDFFLYGIVPGLIWLVTSYILFNGPIPQTAIAKQFSIHTFGPGLHFLLIFFVNRPKLWLLIGIIIIGGCFCWILLNRQNKTYIRKDTYILPYLMFVGYLVVYSFYNPREAMVWYYVLPEFLLVFILLLNSSIIIDFLSDDFKIIERYKYSIIGSLFVLFFVYRAYYSSKEIGGFWYTRTIQETIFIEAGRFIQNNSKASDVLMVGHGYPARESKLYTIDGSGLNYKDITDLKFDFFKINQKYHPDWVITQIALDENNIEIINWESFGYKLVKSYTLNYSKYSDSPKAYHYNILKKE